MIRLLMPTLLALGLISLSAMAQDKEDKKALLKDPEKVFAKIDTDGDKKVSKEELNKFLTTLAKGKLADKADTLGDKLFERLDADKDGKLTPEEFKKLGDLKKLDPEQLKQLKERLKKKKGEPEPKPEPKAETKPEPKKDP